MIKYEILLQKDFKIPANCSIDFFITIKTKETSGSFFKTNFSLIPIKEIPLLHYIIYTHSLKLSKLEQIIDLKNCLILLQ